MARPGRSCFCCRRRHWDQASGDATRRAHPSDGHGSTRFIGDGHRLGLPCVSGTHRRLIASSAGPIGQRSLGIDEEDPREEPFDVGMSLLTEARRERDGPPLRPRLVRRHGGQRRYGRDAGATCTQMVSVNERTTEATAPRSDRRPNSAGRWSRSLTADRARAQVRAL